MRKGLFEEATPGRFTLNETARGLLDPMQRLGLDLNGIGRFDGQHWHDASSGVGNFITCLAIVDDQLLAAWSNSNSATAYHVSVWNGTAWEPLPGVFDPGTKTTTRSFSLLPATAMQWIC